MKNQQLLIILLTSILLRNLLPFVDIFAVVLVLLFLLNQERLSLISLMAILVSFFYSFAVDSPIGLFSLILSVYLLLFGFLFQRFVGKGITPMIIWLLFTFMLLLTDHAVRLLLTTGAIVLPSEFIMKILGTEAIIIGSSFALSFKRKL